MILKPKPGPAVTLGDLIREDKLLWVYGCDCGRERNVTPATVPLPPETPVPDIAKHMKCSACGSRKINTKPELEEEPGLVPEYETTAARFMMADSPSLLLLCCRSFQVEL